VQELDRRKGDLQLWSQMEAGIASETEPGSVQSAAQT
jgi:hypothetical protein